LKIRARKFDGRCSRHKRYNPAVDGAPVRPGAGTACPRCNLLWEIWETSLNLNQLIRRFDPNHDDLQKPADARIAEPDPRQMNLIAE